MRAIKKKRNLTLTAAVRKQRSKKLTFLKLKKESIKALQSLIASVKAAERKLKDKAKETSKVLERFNLHAEGGALYNHQDGSELDRHNPRIQSDIALEMVVEAVEDYLSDIKEIEE